MNNIFQQSRDFSMISEGAWTDWCTMTYTKGELIQRFQQVLRGSMSSEMYIKERALPFALDVEGGE